MPFAFAGLRANRLPSEFQVFTQFVGWERSTYGGSYIQLELLLEASSIGDSGSLVFPETEGGDG